MKARTILFLILGVAVLMAATSFISFRLAQTVTSKLYKAREDSATQVYAKQAVAFVKKSSELDSLVLRNKQLADSLSRRQYQATVKHEEAKQTQIAIDYDAIANKRRKYLQQRQRAAKAAGQESNPD